MFAQKPSKEGAETIRPDIPAVVRPPADEEILSRLNAFSKKIGDPPVVKAPCQPGREEEVLELVDVAPLRSIAEKSVR